jgi:nucleoside-diphosphate-sugar epimerase
MNNLNEQQQQPLVVVTGASGYLAGYIIKLLLERNFRVRGTVRSLTNADTKYRYLYDFADNSNSSLELVEADLSLDANWASIMSNVDYVMHVASPTFEFGSVITDELFSGVAVPGMHRILNASFDANNNKIKKFVYTSSILALGPTIDKQAQKQKQKQVFKVRSPETWSDVNNARLPPYPKSKTLAELALWKFAEQHQNDDCFPIVVINAGLIMGPLMTNRVSGYMCRVFANILCF